jgi:biotin-dependent carboxylase-like uncharacterized protein
MKGFTVEAVSSLATVQDRGRIGYAKYGLGRSGAVDRASLELANRLVGNPPQAAGVEIMAGSLRLRAVGDLTIAVTGGHGQVYVDGRPVGHSCRFQAFDGALLHVAPPTVGVYVYIALRGGIDAPVTFESRSTDSLSALGPPPLAVGQLHRLLKGSLPLPNTDLAPTAMPPDQTVAGVLPGPRSDWFTETSIASMLTGQWTVTDRCNRIGMRLSGPTLVRQRDSELDSEGLTSGAIQVPPSGQPMIFLADHPVTGGYPVVGYLRTTEIGQIAQIRPGGTIRFRPAKS